MQNIIKKKLIKSLNKYGLINVSYQGAIVSDLDLYYPYNNISDKTEEKFDDFAKNLKSIILPNKSITNRGDLVIVSKDSVELQNIKDSICAIESLIKPLFKDFREIMPIGQDISVEKLLEEKVLVYHSAFDEAHDSLELDRENRRR